jgi:hypothetical protein
VNSISEKQPHTKPFSIILIYDVNKMVMPAPN